MRTTELTLMSSEHTSAFTSERTQSIADQQIGFNFKPKAGGVMPTDNQCAFGWVPEGSFGVQSSTIGCSHPALPGYCSCPLTQGSCPKFKSLKNSF